MKRTTIIIISLIIGISFFGLLFLQGRIVQAMVKMRKEQFDETVFRALDQTSRDLERNETFRYLETMAEQTGFKADNLNDKESRRRIEETLELGDTAMTPFRLKTQIAHPSQMPKTLNLRPTASLDVASRRFQEFVKNAYLYQKGVLDEVIYTILYNSSEKDFSERIDFKLLDSNLRTELQAAGITLNYHFSVVDANGLEVYRCEDYNKEGDTYSYTQTLFRNDPSQKMGTLRVHFPDLDSYILGAARTMLPSLLFTLILFFTFCFTVWLIARQKRDTEMKNDFINNMTHEFKTPISSISLAAQMLGDKSITKSESMIDNLSRVIVNETKRLRYQVEKVLQMSLYEKGNIRFNEREVDANVIIDDVVKTFTLKVQQSGGLLEANLDAEDAAIYVDEMHFTNVIFNLLDNAVKYRRDDEPLQLSVATQTSGDKLIVTIQDNGIGIRHDDLKHIFDRFYRVHTGNKHDVKGFGLGLAYVKGMVELMHGNIKAESEYGHGTKFIIILPLID
ncbi:MAG: HAMP domain-containing histidine kinase [Bacteroidaceae bacterium]|nr:HAMP domain-containing histidine kinase [Bacteroidaceae bacterium]MBR1664866.1 HAMP domain-containing histidine kinase [Bacteroidaceae bacterium]MBR1790821.1 HAMP domain-containing histidine kinase [Bacteroidaceae bacterium]